MTMTSDDELKIKFQFLIGKVKHDSKAFHYVPQGQTFQFLIGKVKLEEAKEAFLDACGRVSIPYREGKA